MLNPLQIRLSTTFSFFLFAGVDLWDSFKLPLSFIYFENNLLSLQESIN